MRFFSHLDYYRILEEFLVPYSGPRWPIIPYFSGCLCQSPNPRPPRPHPPLRPFGDHKFVFEVCLSVSVLQISSFASFFFEIPLLSSSDLTPGPGTGHAVGQPKKKGTKQRKPWRLTYTCNLGFKQIASAARPVEAKSRGFRDDSGRG